MSITNEIVNFTMNFIEFLTQLINFPKIKILFIDFGVWFLFFIRLMFQHTFFCVSIHLCWYIHVLCVNIYVFYDWF